jgi:hypothetical protein
MSFRLTPLQLAGMAAIMLSAPAYFACDAYAQSTAAVSSEPHDPGVRGGPAGAGVRYPVSARPN